MRVAMLTGGGDCPGLNAVMRAITRKGEQAYGDELIGLRDGWRGAVEGDLVELSVQSFRGTLPRGGTILGSSRTNPYKVDGGADAVKATLADNDIDALVAIGGDVHGVGEPREQHHREPGPARHRLDRTPYIVAADPGHHDIRENKVKRTAWYSLECLLAAVNHHRFEAVPCQQGRQRRCLGGAVFHDQDPGAVLRHAARRCSGGGGREARAARWRPHLVERRHRPRHRVRVEDRSRRVMAPAPRCGRQYRQGEALRQAALRARPPGPSHTPLTWPRPAPAAARRRP